MAAIAEFYPRGWFDAPSSTQDDAQDTEDELEEILDLLGLNDLSSDSDTDAELEFEELEFDELESASEPDSTFVATTKGLSYEVNKNNECIARSHDNRVLRTVKLSSTQTPVGLNSTHLIVHDTLGNKLFAFPVSGKGTRLVVPNVRKVHMWCPDYARCAVTDTDSDLSVVHLTSGTLTKIAGIPGGKTADPFVVNSMTGGKLSVWSNVSFRLYDDLVY